ncbi:hypothetical protein [Leptolyngbya sp. FACHB-261]|uniref:hypothetical protein n=1 Tax=Leptolyngbya sp. FACHB-261 TaxID=2692806 RepID=UPI001F54D347|nr:hypothetical protein [Leptolyngbya sp. FACHB-261]
MKVPHESVYLYVDELKVVVSHRSDLEWAEKQAARVPSTALKYLQPEWSNREQSTALAIEYVLTHPQWRISLQTHKFLKVR